MAQVNLCSSSNVVSRTAAAAVSSTCTKFRGATSSRLTPGWLKVLKRPYLLERKLEVLKQRTVQRLVLESLGRLRLGTQDEAFRLEDASHGHRLLVVQEKGTIVVASRDIAIGEAVAIYSGELCTLQEVLGRDSHDHQWYQAELALPTGDRLVVDGTYHRPEVAEVCDVRVLGLAPPAPHPAEEQQLSSNHLQCATLGKDLSFAQQYVDFKTIDKLNMPNASQTPPDVPQVAPVGHKINSIDAVGLHDPAAGTCKQGSVALNCRASSDEEHRASSLSALHFTPAARQKAPLQLSPSAGGIAGSVSGVGYCSNLTPVGKVPTGPLTPVGKPTGSWSPDGKPSGPVEPGCVAMAKPQVACKATNLSPTVVIQSEVACGASYPKTTATPQQPAAAAAGVEAWHSTDSYCLVDTVKQQVDVIGVGGDKGAAAEKGMGDAMTDTTSENTLSCIVHIDENLHNSIAYAAGNCNLAHDKTAAGGATAASPRHQRERRSYYVKDKLDANVALVGVLDLDREELLMLVVAVNDIRAGEELMMDYGEDYWQQRLVQLNGLSISDQEKARLKAELAYVKRELAAMKASIRPLVEENVQLKLAAEQGSGRVLERELQLPSAASGLAVEEELQRQMRQQLVLTKPAAHWRQLQESVVKQELPDHQQQEQTVCSDDEPPASPIAVATPTACKLPHAACSRPYGNGKPSIPVKVAVDSADGLPTAVKPTKPSASPPLSPTVQLQALGNSSCCGKRSLSAPPTPLAATTAVASAKFNPAVGGSPSTARKREHGTQQPEQGQIQHTAADSRHKLAAERLLFVNQQHQSQQQAKRQQPAGVRRSPIKAKVAKIAPATGPKVQVLDSILDLPAAAAAGGARRSPGRPASRSPPAAGAAGHGHGSRNNSGIAASKQPPSKQTAAGGQNTTTIQRKVPGVKTSAAATGGGGCGTAAAGVTPVPKRAALPPAKRPAMSGCTTAGLNEKISRAPEQQQQQTNKPRVGDLTSVSPETGVGTMQQHQQKQTPCLTAGVSRSPTPPAAAAPVAVVKAASASKTPPLAVGGNLLTEEAQQPLDGKDRQVQQKQQKTPLVLDSRSQGQDDWQRLRQQRRQREAAQRLAKQQQMEVAATAGQQSHKSANMTGVARVAATVSAGKSQQQQPEVLNSSEKKRKQLSAAADDDVGEFCRPPAKRLASNAVVLERTTEASVCKAPQHQAQPRPMAPAAPQPPQEQSKPLNEQQKEELIELAADDGVLVTVLEQPSWDDLLKSFELHQTQHNATRSTEDSLGQQRPRVCRFGCCSLID